MKERLFTLALAACALALFYLLFFPKPTIESERISLPMSTERGPNGYAAMDRWLQLENLSLLSLRERYDRLATIAPEGGHLLITTLPHRLNARTAELEALSDWLRNGNTMLVMAALADTPDWAIFERDMLEQMRALTGIRFLPLAAPKEEKNADEKGADVPEKGGETQKPKKRDLREAAAALQKLNEPQHFRLEPIGAHPLTEGVRSVAALSEFPAGDWSAHPDKVDAVMELARDPDSKVQPREPVLWLAQSGKGQIIVCGYGSPFTNKLLGEADNARLLANVIGWSVGKQGRIIIDDAHQGAVAFYDPAAFFGDKRLHHALIWLGVLWLVFVLGPTRLRPVAPNWNPVDVTSFIRSTGGFLARTLKPATAARRAFTHFFNAVRARIGLVEDGKPVWEWLASRPQIEPLVLAELRTLHARALAGKRIDLVKLHNLLHRLTESFV